MNGDRALAVAAFPAEPAAVQGDHPFAVAVGGVQVQALAVATQRLDAFGDPGEVRQVGEELLDAVGRDAGIDAGFVAQRHVRVGVVYDGLVQGAACPVACVLVGAVGPHRGVGVGRS